ncbi:MAG: DUF444 family protein, partial [Candidatus Woesearchaeota archaeon]
MYTEKDHEEDQMNKGPTLDDFLRSARRFSSIRSDVSGEEEIGGHGTHDHSVSTLQDMIERDKQREKDGYPKIGKVGKFTVPSKKGNGKVIIVPHIEEARFEHDPSYSPPGLVGQGDGEEGEVIGEEQAKDADSEDDSGQGPGGEGESEEHGLIVDIAEYGEMISERFNLPNIDERGKKKTLPIYYDKLRGLRKGFGSHLDEERTMEEIIGTNLILGNIDDDGTVDFDNLVVSPDDFVYWTYAETKDYESQALVFFMRDYSGSMSGLPTDVLRQQHLTIYAWLLYNYNEKVESRYVLHDTEAFEVPDFNTYWRKQTAGGTKVMSGLKYLNDTIKNENLARDYNLYVFYGTDGDDWPGEEEETINE